MDVTKKSLGMLVDELITTSLKCFMAQERVMNSESDTEVCAAARIAQEMNARRNLLIRAIDERTEDEFASPSGKTYA